jgi:hypothetical protein
METPRNTIAPRPAASDVCREVQTRAHHAPRGGAGAHRQGCRLRADDRERHSREERDLLGQHAVSSAEPLEVARRHVCDDRRRGCDDAAQARKLPGNARSRLDHERVRVIRCTEDRERHPDFVVQVPACGVHAPPGAERAGGQLLGRRLAVGAGDRDHRSPHRLAPPPRQSAEGLQRVVDREQAEPGNGRRTAPHDRRDGSPVAGRLQKIVRVEPLPPQSHEQVAGTERPRIRDYPGTRESRWHLDAQGLRDARAGPEAHRRALSSASRTITCSSNGSRVVPTT